MIHFEDKVEFDISIESMWKIVNDKEVMAKCIPTLKTYRIVDDDHVEGIVRVQLGLIPVESRVTLEVVERAAPYRVVGKGVSFIGESLASQVKGELKPGGVNKDSVGVFTVSVNLERNGFRKTQAVVTIDVEAEGKLKRIYDSIMAKKLPSLRAEFLERITAVIGERLGEEPAKTQTIVIPQATDRIQYSFFGKLINLFVGSFNRFYDFGKMMIRP